MWDGGSSFLNSLGKRYILNDADSSVISLHKELGKYAGNSEELLEKLYSIIDYYGLSCSYRGINVPEEMKKKYVKTYYSKYNKEAYLKLWQSCLFYAHNGNFSRSRQHLQPKKHCRYTLFHKG